MSNPALAFLDMIMGLDIHIIQPPGPFPPMPFPHPYIGMYMDPTAYLPVVGSTVFIGGYPAVIAGTPGMATPPHIPLGGMFVKPPMSESEQFMGSSTVIFDGDAAGYNGLPALSDQCIGMPAPFRLKKKGAAKSLFLPVSSATAIPKGKPVTIGGSPSILAVFTGAVTNGAMGAAMGAAGKAAKGVGKALQRTKAAKQVSKAAHKAAGKVMDKAGIKKGSKVRNQVHEKICSVTGHPVDVASGNMFDIFEDFRLGDTTPFVWRRKYNSTHADTPGPLGLGFTHSHDVWLKKRDGHLEVRLADGRDIVFPGKLAIQAYVTKDDDRLTLRRPSVDIFELEDDEKSVFRFTRNDAVQDLFVLSDLRYRGGRTLLYRYDENARLTFIEDGKRRIQVVWEHDRIIGVRGPSVLQGTAAGKDGTWMVRYDYDAQKRLIAIRDQAQQVARFEYLADTGLVVKEQRKTGVHFYFSYDGTTAEAKCTRTWGDGGIFDHKLSYGDDQTEVTDSLGNKRIYKHEGGLVTALVDELGVETTTLRDEQRRVQMETDGLGRTTRYRYDDRGNMISIERPDGGIVSLAYDKDDLLVQVTYASGRTWKYGYNDNHQLVMEQSPDGLCTRYVYEGSNLVSKLEPGERRTEYGYDENGELVRVVLPNGAETEIYRDGLGRVTQVVDAEEDSEFRRYDSHGHLYEVERPHGAEGGITRFEYNGDGMVTKQDDGRDIVELEYFGLGQIKARTVNGKRRELRYDTEGQVVGFIDEWGQKTQFQLNRRGELVQQTNPFLVKTQFQRNAGGELSAVIHPDGKVTRVKRDPLGQVREVQHRTDGKKGTLGDVVERFRYDEDGFMTHAERSGPSETHQVRLRRDQAGRVVEEEVEEVSADGHPARQETLRRFFGAAGDLEQTTSSLGFTQRFGRDKVGHLTSIEGSVVRAFDGVHPNFDFQTKWGRNPFGEVTRQWMPSFEVSHQLSKTGELQEIEVRSTAEQTGLGRSTLLRRTIRPEAYSEAHLNRSTREGLARMAQHNFSFLGTALLSGETEMCLSGELTSLYRDRGSRSDWSVGPARKTVQHKDAQGRRTDYTYDKEGRIAERQGPTGVWRYRYNSAGQLRKVYRGDGRVVELSYDALGRCIERKDERVRIRFVWSGGTPLHEIREMLAAPETARKGKVRILGVSDVGSITKQSREATHPALSSVEAMRLGGQVMKTWMFSPEDGTLLGKVEHDHDGKVTEDATLYAINDEVGMPCALLDADGKTRWKDDKWRERRGCFAAGTLVHTKDGPMPIEQVKLGTQVKTMRSVREEAEDRPRSLMKSALRSGLAVAASLASFFVPATGSAELESQTTANESFAEEQQIATLTFSADDDPEHIYAIELLRPRSWFEAQGVQGPGDRLRLQIDELQAEGWASVTKLEAGAGAAGSGQTIMRLSHLAGTSSGGPGEHVRRDLHEEEARRARDSLRHGLSEVRAEGRGAKGWVERAKHPTEAQATVARGFHEAVLEEAQEIGNDVYEVSFVEGGEVLRETGGHPLYSLDRDDWVRVRDLQIGERLQTAEGAATVEALEKVRGAHRVYNLEVEGDHEYLVGEAGVRAHNATRRVQLPDDETFPSQSAARREALRRHGVPTSSNDISEVPDPDKNPNIRGPRNEKASILKGVGANGKPVEIKHHKWGHYFADTDEYELAHYHGPKGEHLSYGDVPERVPGGCGK